MVLGGQWVVDNCYGRLEAGKEVGLQPGWLRRDMREWSVFWKESGQDLLRIK